MLRLIVAEDHHLLRQGLRVLLESTTGINIVDEATNGRELLDILACQNEIDMVLTDLNLAKEEGFDLVSQIKVLYPKVKVVVLAKDDHQDHFFEAFASGADGFLLNSVQMEELLFAIRHIHQGGRYLCTQKALYLVEQQLNRHALTLGTLQYPLGISPRERQVLQLLADGATTQEMADLLFVSRRTIEGHRQKLLEKVGAKNTASLVSMALRSGLID